MYYVYARGGGALGYLGWRICSLSKLRNTPKALISGQKSTLILIKHKRKLGSPVTSGVTRRQSRAYFVDCKGILTPILRTWVQKSTLLLQNRGHAEFLKKDPFFREIRNAGAPPPPHGCVCSVLS